MSDLLEDQSLKFLEGGTRNEAGFFTEMLRCSPVGPERVGLSAGTVERKHQQAPQFFAERRVNERGLEFRDGVAVSLEIDERVDALFDDHVAQRVEPSRFCVRDRIEASLLKGLPAPEAERLGEGFDRCTESQLGDFGPARAPRVTRTPQHEVRPAPTRRR